MGKLSVLARNELLDHMFNAAYSPPATVYLCLCTADPTEDGTGASCSESADAAAYARQAIAFSAASGRKVVQNGQVDFPKATAGYGAAITHWAICDSATHGAGNMLAYGAFSASFTPVLNNVPYIPDAELEISIGTDADSGFTTYAVHKMLDLMFRNTAWSTPSAAIYVALTTDTIAATDTDISTDCTEESATDYARVQVNVNGGSAPAWTVASAGALSNGADIDIIANADWTTDDWGTDVAMALVDAASGSANILAYDNANIVDQSPNTGDDLKFESGDLDIALN